MTIRLLFNTVILTSLIACQPAKNSSALEGEVENSPSKHQYPLAIEHDKFSDDGGNRYLYGGDKAGEAFDITDYTLKDEQFHFGIGRERFPALLEPKFMNMLSADTVFDDTVRFLFLNMDGVRKAYSIKDLTHHEVVNDEINGKPVMAAYCILADLGAVYDRTLHDKKFTFALSGYTYFDSAVWDGMDGFVLWDRETESLWWPLIGKAVSGPMKGSKMKVLDENLWSQTSWGEIKKLYTDVQVLIPGQDFDRPASWIKYTDVLLKDDSEKSIAPKWGDNR